MSDVSSLSSVVQPSVVQQTTELANPFVQGVEKVIDFLDSTHHLKEKLFSSIPKYFDRLNTYSLQTSASRFRERVIAINVSASPISEWGSKALLALGVVTLVGLGGGLGFPLSWRMRTFTMLALGLMGCIGGSAGPSVTQPPVRNDGGLTDLDLADLRSSISAAKNFAYIPSAETGSVLEINTQTDIPNNFPIARVADHTFGIAVTSNRVYLTNSLLQVIDTSILPKAIVARVGPLCQTGGTAGYVAVLPNEEKAYVSCHTLGSSNCNELDVVDTKTLRIMATPLLGSFSGKNCSGPLAASLDNRRVYVVNTALGLVVMDTFTDGIAGNIQGICGEDYEGGVAVTPDSRKVYVAGTRCNSITVIDVDADKNKIVATIPVGKQPNGVAITPNVRNDPDIPSGHRVYVANTGDNTISVINAATDTVITIIPLNGQKPVGLSLTSDGKKLYVTYYESPLVTVIDTYTHKILNDLQMAPSWISGQFISPELF